MASSRLAEEVALDDLLKDQIRIEELPSDDGDDDFEDIEDAGDSMIPASDIRTALPLWLQPQLFNLFHDELVSTTSEVQQKTLNECLPFLLGNDSDKPPLNSQGLPRLRKKDHAAFLTKAMDTLPAGYVVADASRPWFFYWCLNGLATLGQDVTAYRERLIETVRPLQNTAGGFGGGHGQYSHAAGTYACVLALAVVGGLQTVDRKAMWHWLGTMKQADGGFTMSQGAEEDIRGAYCAMTVVSLLNLPLELPPESPARRAGLTSFVDKLGEWIGRCQTFEGGIAGAPHNEAHGAYAFCALACLSLLDAPHISLPKHLNLRSLLACLTGLQTSPEGGFAGRANKLVDACYSHWVGGCWSILQAALAGPDHIGKTSDLWNREALIRYLFSCCQQHGKKGGMRDKPSTRADAYHTSYSLAGVSHAQHHYIYDAKASTIEEPSGRLLAAYNWSAEHASEEERKAWRYDADDTVGFVHPVFVIPFEAVERARVQFAVREI